jgi:uncharacterized C2H2 Zn-finger protein
METHSPKAETVQQVKDVAPEAGTDDVPLPPSSKQAVPVPVSSKRSRQDVDGSQPPSQKRSRTTAVGSANLTATSSMSPHASMSGQLMRLPPSKMAYVLASADPFATLPESVTEAFGLGASSPMSMYRRMSSDDGGSLVVPSDNGVGWGESGPGVSPTTNSHATLSRGSSQTAQYRPMPSLHAFPIAPSLHPTISSSSMPSSLEEDEEEEEDTGSEEDVDLNTTSNSNATISSTAASSAVHRHAYVFVPSHVTVKGDLAQSLVRMVPIPPSKLRGIPGLAQVLLHQCPYTPCSRTFKQKRDLRAHVRYDHEHDFLTCPHCDKTFKRPKFWERHVVACESVALALQSDVKKETMSGDASLQLSHQPPQEEPMSDFLMSALNVDPADIARDLNAGRSAFLLSPEFLSLPEPAVPGLTTRRRASFEIPSGSVSLATGGNKAMSGGMGISGDVAI